MALDFRGGLPGTGREGERMKITKIETIQVKEFFHVLWVQVYTDEGQVGLGETWYLPRAVASVIHDVYSAHLIGRNPMDREALWNVMYGIAEGAAHAAGAT